MTTPCSQQNYGPVVSDLFSVDTANTYSVPTKYGDYTVEFSSSAVIGAKLVGNPASQRATAYTYFESAYINPPPVPVEPRITSSSAYVISMDVEGLSLDGLHDRELYVEVYVGSGGVFYSEVFTVSTGSLGGPTLLLTEWGTLELAAPLLNTNSIEILVTNTEITAKFNGVTLPGQTGVVFAALPDKHLVQVDLTRWSYDTDGYASGVWGHPTISNFKICEPIRSIFWKFLRETTETLEQ